MHVGTRAESAEMPRQNELMVLSIVIEAWPGGKVSICWTDNVSTLTWAVRRLNAHHIRNSAWSVRWLWCINHMHYGILVAVKAPPPKCVTSSFKPIERGNPHCCALMELYRWPHACRKWKVCVTCASDICFLFSMVVLHCSSLKKKLFTCKVIIDFMDPWCNPEGFTIFL